MEPIAEKFVGPTALVMSYDDVVAGEAPRGVHEGPRELQHPHRGDPGAVVDAKGSRPWRSCQGSRTPRPDRRDDRAARDKLARLIGGPGQQLARVLGARREQLEKPLNGT